MLKPLTGAGATTALRLRPLTAATLVDAERHLAEMLERTVRASVSIANATIDPRSDEHAVLSEAVEQARALVGARFAALGVGTDPTRPFAPWVVRGFDPELTRHFGPTPRPVGALGETSRGTSFLSVPLCARDEAVGVLYLANKAGAEELSANDRQLVTLLASQIGMVVWNRRLYGVLALERERFELLAASSAALARTLDLEATLQYLADATVPKLADWSVVWTADDARGFRPRAQAHVADLCGQPLPDFLDLPPTRKDGPGDRELPPRERAFSVPLDDPASAPPGVESWARVLRDLRFESALAVPILREARIIAIMGLASRTKDRYGRDGAALAEEIGRRAGLALTSACLYREARDATRSRDEAAAPRAPGALTARPRRDPRI